MKENISITIAVLAIVFAIVAVTTSFVKTSDFTIGAGTISGNELADNSVTSDHIVDGTITDDDISDSGLSRIADESITLSDLTSEVLAEMSGVVEILDNSILGSKLANASIFNRHIAESAEIDPSKILGIAWTAENDGSDSGLDADKLDGITSSQFVRSGISTTKFYTIPYCAFQGADSDTPYSFTYRTLRNTDPAYASHSYVAPVFLPDGAELKKMAIGYKLDDSAATASVYLSKGSEFNNTLMESIALPESSVFTSYESTISGTVSTQGTPYRVSITINPNDSSFDVTLGWICIEYTVTS